MCASIPAPLIIRFTATGDWEKKKGLPHGVQLTAPQPQLLFTISQQLLPRRQKLRRVGKVKPRQHPSTPGHIRPSLKAAQTRERNKAACDQTATLGNNSREFLHSIQTSASLHPCALSRCSTSHQSVPLPASPGVQRRGSAGNINLPYNHIGGSTARPQSLQEAAGIGLKLVRDALIWFLNHQCDWAVSFQYEFDFISFQICTPSLQPSHFEINLIRRLSTLQFSLQPLQSALFGCVNSSGSVWFLPFRCPFTSTRDQAVCRIQQSAPISLLILNCRRGVLLPARQPEASSMRHFCADLLAHQRLLRRWNSLLS